MSQTPLRAIHVGTGGRGTWPIDVVTADPNWESVALVDVNETFLERAREKTGLGKSACFSSLADAAKAVEADAALICTPTETHAPFLRAAFEAGLHAVVEKGMTTDLPLAKALVKEAEAAGVKFCVAQNYRYQSLQQTLKTILDEGEHGAPEFLDLIHHRYRPEPRTLNYPNAMIWDMSCHHFDNLIFWFGLPQTVVSKTFNTSWSKYAHDAGVYAIFQYENGMVCNYGLTHCAQNDSYYLLMHTDKGTLRTYDVKGVEFRPTGGGERETLDLLSLPRSEQLVLNALRDYIQNDVEPGISGRANLRTLAMCQATCDAAETGQPIDIAQLLSDM
jgi:predicted dehydrogenase